MFATRRSSGLLLLPILLAVACASGEPPGRPAALPPAPSTAGAPGPSRLRLATWNVAWLAGREGVGEIPRGAADYARLAGYARRLDADVVALQEVDGEPAARRILDPANYEFHFTHEPWSVQRAGFAIRRGLNWSPHPDVVELSAGRTRRGADITVELGDRRVRLLSIHLKTGCWDRPPSDPEPACVVLREQFTALERWIDERAAGGEAFAVLGDFNRRLNERDPLWRDLDDGAPAGLDLVNLTEGRRSACWGGEYPRFVDHILLDRRAAAWLVPKSFHQLVFDDADRPHKRQLSDHCPIEAVLDAGTP